VLGARSVQLLHVVRGKAAVVDLSEKVHVVHTTSIVWCERIRF
jgi:hypothetical protein